MKRKLSLLAMFLCALIGVQGAVKPPQGNLVLWYKQPAVNWMTSALPIGNGRIGAMIFGGVEKEQIQFNDKSLWTGNKTDRGNYQNFGDVHIQFEGQENHTDYVRDLNLEDATAHVSYKANGVSYSREYFASHPDNVIVMNFTADKKGKLSFNIKMDDAHDAKAVVKGNQVSLSGKLTLLSYEASVTVVNDGGQITVDGSSLKVSGANSAKIILVASTDYDPTKVDYLTTKNWKAELENARTKAIAKPYQQQRKDHVQDYQALFNRVTLNVGNVKPTVPTNELLADYSKGKYNSAVDMLFFQYGRYLAISSSREGFDLPSNLQGLWNNSNNPPWGSDIHSNINVQMNYWLTEVANLPECHMPFINYVKNEAMDLESWRSMASELGARGWVMKTQSNIFGYSDWLWNRPANGWYCMHLWDKYLYNPDKEYLKNTAYPVMKSACEFWFDRLMMDDNGQLIAVNEWSPENGPWENGVAYAQQIIWDLFTNTLQAAEILGDDANFAKELKGKLSKLDAGLSVGSWGQLREWKYTDDDPENKHRHISHLMALYPGRAISPLLNADYANAARKTLEGRGDSGTGWSRVWKIAFWARLLDGNRAHKLMISALDLTSDTGMDYMEKGGVYENMFDAHPPFQIDGNLGATACMSEMLLQSHLGEIHLLPALPDVWKQGEVKGLRARGAFDVDIKWANNKLVTAKVKANQGGVCKLRTGNPIKIVGQAVTSTKDDKGYYLTTLTTQAGKVYQVTAN